MKLRTISTLVLSLYTLGYIPTVLLKTATLNPKSDAQFAQEHDLDVEASPNLSRQQVESTKPDGLFNGFDLHKVDRPPRTDIHCVGENFQDEQDRDYMFRSCRFETFCFDTKLNEFVVYPEAPLNASIYSDVWSSTHNPENYTSVVAGAQSKLWWPIYWNERDGKKTRVGKYKPKFVYPDHDGIPTSYYRFNATWLPFYRHQRSPYNPGQLIWDDFLGLYTLLDMFDQADEDLLLTHMIRQAHEDFEGDEPLEGFDLITKFLPLMGRHEYGLQTLQGDYTLKLSEEKDHGAASRNERPVICAGSALIGSGVLSDHGDHHWHGHKESDFQDPHNIGKGGLFRRFRQWMMKHVSIDPQTPMQIDPYLIVVSEASSTKADRKDVKFDKQISVLKKKFHNRALVRRVQLNKISLTEQVELLSRTAVFISMVGGGTVTATFLPKGSSVILYHREERPLDWDWWNNFPQISAHWFLKEYMNDEFHLSALVETVSSQLDYLDRH